MAYRRRSHHRLIAIMSLVLCVSGCASAPGARPAPRPAAPSASSDLRPSPSAYSSSPTLDPDTYQPRAIAPAALPARFAYDRAAPLHLTVTHTRFQAGATIQSVTYQSGTTSVFAEIVFPTARHHRLPGIVYAHGGAIDPDAFLADALAMVKHGVVAILPDIPITIVGDPTTDISYVTGSVIAERRALDILTARPDVDPGRLAFVGHSWGADLAAIMAGVEPRLEAVAIVCGWSRMSTDMLAMGNPAGAADYLSAATVLDGFRYVAIPGRRHILIQYGTQDPNIPAAQRTELTHAAAGGVVRKDYDAGHDLINQPSAAADRLAFLTGTLH